MITISSQAFATCIYFVHIATRSGNVVLNKRNNGWI